MAKKARGKGVTDSGKWDDGLIKETVDDVRWHPCLVLLVPCKPEAQVIIDSVFEAVNGGSRRRFMGIRKETMLLSAKEEMKLLSATSVGKKGKQVSGALDHPLHFEVCEHVVNALSAGAVPPPLVARMLKYVVLKRKTQDLLKEEPAKQEPESNAKSVKPPTKKGGGRVSKKGKDTPGSDANDDIALPQKASTAMKRRGEESDDAKYIDDEPVPGPDAYFILHGFHDTEVILQLHGIGLQVQAVIKVDILEKLGKGSLQEGEKGSAESEEFSFPQFWMELRSVIRGSQPSSRLKDIALVEYAARMSPESGSNSEEYCQDLFSSIAKVLYSLVQSHCEYNHYLECLDARAVPMMTESESPPARATVDMRCYNELLCGIPVHMITPEVVMNFALKQVCSGENSSSQSSSVCIHARVQKELSCFSAHSLLLSNEHKEVINVVNKKPAEVHMHHIALDEACQVHNDQDQRRKAFFRPLCTTSSLLEHYLHLPDSITADVMLYREMLHSLLAIGVSIPSVKSLLPIFNQLLVLMSLEHIPVPSASQPPPSSLGISEQDLIFDFPLKLDITSCSDTNSGCVPALVLPMSTQDTREYTVLEPLKKDAVIKAIQQHLYTHPYLQIFHHKLSNSLVAMLHTGCDDGGVHSYSWTSYSHSKVGFNTYLQYMAKCLSYSAMHAVEEKKESVVNKQIVEPTISEVERRKNRVHNEQQTVVNDTQQIKNGPQSDSPSKLNDTEESLSPVCNRMLFHGYDIGDQALLVEGFVSTVCTNDGSQIVSKRTGFVENYSTHQVLLIDECITISSIFLQAPSSASSFSHESRNTDACNSASVHNKPELLSIVAQPPSDIVFASVHISLPEDGLNIVLSKFGPQGNGVVPLKPKSSEHLTKLDCQQPQVEKDSRPQSRQGASPQPKLTKKQQEQQQILLDQQRVLDEKRIQQRKDIESKLQIETEAISRIYKSPQLSLTTKDGLQIVCSEMSAKSSSVSSRAIITQRFIGDVLTGPTALPVKEVSRDYFPDGSVLCKYSNNTRTIMCADGRMFATWPEPVIQGESGQPFCPKQSTTEIQSVVLGVNEVAGIHVKGQETKSSSHVQPKSVWLATTPHGHRYLAGDDGLPVSLQHIAKDDPSHSSSAVQYIPHQSIENSTKDLNVYSATDPVSNEVLVVREDNVILVQKQDRSVVEFSDGTRITSLNINSQSDLASSCVWIENPSFARVQYSHSGKCIVSLPGRISVECFDGEHKILKPDTITLSVDGMGELDCSIAPAFSASPCKQYAVSHSLQTGKPLLSGVDSTGMQYSVLHTGEITKTGKVKTSNLDVQGTLMLSPKVFIVSDDDTCYEVHPKMVLEEAIKKAKEDVGLEVITQKVPQCELCEATTIVMSQSLQTSNTGMHYREKCIVPLNLQDVPLWEVRTKSSSRRFGVSVGKALTIVSCNTPADAPQCESKKLLTYRQLVQLPNDFFGSLHSVVAKYIQLHHSKKEKGESFLPLTLQRMGEQPVPCSFSYSEFDPSQLVNLFEIEQSRSVVVDTKNGHVISKPTERLFKNKFDHHVRKKKSRVPYFESEEGLSFLHKTCNTSQNGTTTKTNLPEDTSPKTVPKISATTGMYASEPGIVLSGNSNMENKLNHQHTASPKNDQISCAQFAPADGKTGSIPGASLTSQTPQQDSTISTPNIFNVSKVQNQRKKVAMSGQESHLVEDNDAKQPLASSVQQTFSSLLSAQSATTWKFRGNENLFHPKIGHIAKQGKVARRFITTPTSLDYGVLKDGCTYKAQITLKNVGMDPCHFKIVQPPSSTGISCIYTPGFVVPGLTRAIEVQLLVTATKCLSLNYILEIITEGNVLKLPITASLLPQHEFHQLYGSDPLAGANPQIVVVSHNHH